MRLVGIGALLASLLASCAVPAGAALVDAVVATVDSTTVSASDIALARALGLLGFTPSGEPIRSADVERYAAALVDALEASQLGIGPAREELDRAWTVLEARVGGESALRDWLRATTIDEAWVRRALETHLRWDAWRTLHRGLVIETPGGTPEPPAARSDLVVRGLLSPQQTIAVPFAMPPDVGR